MSEFKPKMHDQDLSIKMLESANIPVQEKPYGFRILLPVDNVTDRNFIECGCEHNGSISLAIRNNKTNRVNWYFRFSFTEASEFLIDSFKVLASKYTCQDIVENMKLVDAKYDHDTLEKRIEEQELDFKKYLQNIR